MAFQLLKQWDRSRWTLRAVLAVLSVFILWDWTDIIYCLCLPILWRIELLKKWKQLAVHSFIIVGLFFFNKRAVFMGVVFIAWLFLYEFLAKTIFLRIPTLTIGNCEDWLSTHSGLYKRVGSVEENCLEDFIEKIDDKRIPFILTCKEPSTDYLLWAEQRGCIFHLVNPGVSLPYFKNVDRCPGLWVKRPNQP